MVDVVEALYEKIVRLIDVGIETLACVEKLAGNFTFVCDVFFSEQVSRFFPLWTLCDRSLDLGWLFRSCTHEANTSREVTGKFNCSREQ